MEAQRRMIGTSPLLDLVKLWEFGKRERADHQARLQLAAQGYTIIIRSRTGRPLSADKVTGNEQTPKP
jgi:hypothetical protein